MPRRAARRQHPSRLRSLLNHARYDANDRLSTETYDNNGNTTVSGARTFAYDFENRLKSMNNGAVTVQYDGDGNRVAKTAGGVTTRYLVDDLNPTGYAQVVEETAGGTAQRTYTYGLQRINQSQIINSAWTPSFYGYDGFGSVHTLTDATGAVTDTYDYDAWGNAVNVTGSTPNVYLYRAEQFDPDLGLYYLRARYFNTVTGRFLSMDPAKGDVTDPNSLHKYLYANADPVDRIDPTGWKSILIFDPYAANGGYLAYMPTLIPAFIQLPIAKLAAFWGDSGCCWKVMRRELRGLEWLGRKHVCHVYLYNTCTRKSIGLGAGEGLGVQPVPGKWETNEKPGEVIANIPAWSCSCIDRKAGNPGPPPRYCIDQEHNKGCINCYGWVAKIQGECWNEKYNGDRSQAK